MNRSSVRFRSLAPVYFSFRTSQAMKLHCFVEWNNRSTPSTFDEKSCPQYGFSPPKQFCENQSVQAGGKSDKKLYSIILGFEPEMIIQRGAHYRITKIEKQGGQLYIDVEVLPEMGYNTFQQDGKWSGSKKKYKD